MKKVLYYVVFAAVTFVVTLAILSQRLDTNYIIERDIQIKAPIAKVFAVTSVHLRHEGASEPWLKPADAEVIDLVELRSRRSA